jgi:hypothetical protein
MRASFPLQPRAAAAAACLLPGTVTDLTGDVAVTIAVMDEGVASGQVPESDKWPAQVKEAFGFVEELGFRVVDSGTYRLGNWTLLGNGNAGIHLDCDGDTRSLEVKLIRLDSDQMPPRWWEPQIPRVSLRLREVAELVAPQSLADQANLPPIEREADRAPHLHYWAAVLQAAAADWLHGDRTWFDAVEGRLRDELGR